MRGRQFISLLGRAAALWPLAAHAQQSGLKFASVVNATTELVSISHPNT